MSQPQPQQQTRKPEPQKPADSLDGFTPDDSTLWLCQQNMNLDGACTLALQERYDQLIGRIVTQYDVRRLSERHTIVPVFVDLRATVRDAATGKLRPRKLRGADKDPIEVLFGKPVRCKDLITTDEDSGYTNVRTVNQTDENGRTVKGLLALVSDACMRPNARGKLAAGCRARLHDHTITLTDL